MPVIRVADTGPGVPAAEREAIVKRFYRADKSRHIRGHGLGLSLVSAIVNLHGFRLRIGDNAPGATFDLVCDNGDPDVRPAGWSGAVFVEGVLARVAIRRLSP
ncbi:MAG TPA: ATP-binding protein [Aliidongia sp.]|nr:ATP-binding protein [Aliidongia sp.]